MRLEILDTPDLQSFVMVNERKPGGSGGEETEEKVSASAPEPAQPALTRDKALPVLWLCLGCSAAVWIAFAVRKRK